VVRRGTGVSSPTNWHTPLFGPVAEGADPAERLWHGLFRAGPRHLSLSFLDADDPSLASLRDAAGQAGYRTVERTLGQPWYASLEEGWAAYAANRIKKPLRGKLARSRRRLSEIAPLSFQSHEGAAAVADVSEVIAVEARGWKGKGGTAISSRQETDAFYREVASWAAGRGTLAVSTLRLDGIGVIAGEIALHESGRHLGLKVGFDQRYARFGPGMLLIASVIEAACEQGLTAFEFQGDDGAWKARWSTGRHRLVRWDAFARSPAGRASYVLHRSVRPLLVRARDGLRARATSAHPDG
jgi:CelD/BcsL family acetyltransferase involved in cellulose biosynthesis